MCTAHGGVTSSAVLGVLARWCDERSREEKTAKWRIAAQAASMTATAALVVVGCTAITAGSPAANTGDAASYRRISADSSSHYASQASARESTRRESMTAEAVANGCELLSSSSVDVVTAINAYVNVSGNGNEADVQTKAQAAVDSLNRAADSVASSLNTPLLPAVADAFGPWVDATRAVGKAIGERYAQQEFNADVIKFNQANANALNMCGGSR
jgi:hypothetical protein